MKQDTKTHNFTDEIIFTDEKGNQVKYISAKRKARQLNMHPDSFYRKVGKKQVPFIIFTGSKRKWFYDNSTQ